MTCDNAVKTIEDNVLFALWNECLPEGYYCYTKTIVSRLGIPKEYVSVALKSLRNKGFVEYRRGLWNEDECITAGSGYALTEKGQRLAEQM